MTNALITYEPEKVQLIKRTIAKDATDDELKLFLYQAQKTGLDPLARQIHFQKYNTKNGPQMAIITSIDGYRLTADRTTVYAGNDDPAFGNDNDLTYNGQKYTAPETATVTVWKIVSGQRCPFTATARWSEYYPGDKRGFNWRKMPYLMLGKCAEALALRKAFPAELSGVYTKEEMDQAGDDIVTVEPKPEKSLTELTKVEFANRCMQDFQMTPDHVLYYLTSAGKMNGEGYQPEKAEEYWEALIDIDLFAGKVLNTNPFFETLGAVHNAMVELEIVYSVDDEPAHVERLEKYATEAADSKAGG